MNFTTTFNTIDKKYMFSIKSITKNIIISFIFLLFITCYFNKPACGKILRWEMSNSESLEDWDILRKSEAVISSNGLLIRGTTNPTITNKSILDIDPKEVDLLKITLHTSITKKV